jgi:predicted TIM-barrel fold metal-dependent hydrolase
MLSFQSGERPLDRGFVARGATARGHDIALGSRRVLFGSDFTVADPCVTRTRVEHAYLSAEEKQDILSRNAYQLLARLGKTFPAA